MTLRGRSCCLSSTDTFIVSTSANNTLKVWDVATGNCTHTFPDFGEEYALSGDDRRIAAVDWCLIRTLNIETGEIQTEQLDIDVWSVCWSSDDQFLVIGTKEGVQIRDANTLKLFNLEATEDECVNILMYP
jgi:WD40 repeat protein